MGSTRGQAAGKAENQRRLGHYAAVLLGHGDKEVVKSLAALMRAIVDRLVPKSRPRRGRRHHPTA